MTAYPFGPDTSIVRELIGFKVPVNFVVSAVVFEVVVEVIVLHHFLSIFLIDV
jgi:hypothetical protein